MKIIFCIKSMATSGGGAERVLANVTSALAQRGYSIYLLTFDEPGYKSFYKLDSRIQILSIGIGNVTLPATISESIKRIKAIRLIVKKLKPTCLIGFMHSIYIPLGFALWDLNIPIIASEHTVFQHYKRFPFQRFAIQIGFFLLNKITVVSEQAMLSFPNRLQKKMAVIQNPILISNLGPRANVGGYIGKQKVLLTVGRLSRVKDHRTLIEAFGKIVDLLPDWDLHIVGEGECRKELEWQISSLNLKKRVSLVGAVSDIENRYLSSQLFVMTSLYESFGLTTVESLSYGLPVIAFSDCSGINTLVKNNVNGILVKTDTSRENALADALFLLMSNNELRVSLSDNCELLQGYEINEVTDCWEKLIYELTLSMHHK